MDKERKWTIDVCPVCGRWELAMSRKVHFVYDEVANHMRRCEGQPQRVKVVPASEGTDELATELADERTLHQQTMAERDEAREELAIAKMERDWLLGAWAAATETPQAEAEAEFLKWSSKWRETARSQPSSSDG